MELRCNYCWDYGCIYVVHSAHHGLAVSWHSHPDPTTEKLIQHSRTRFRREANVADNKAATVAVDSLINYEAVKVCLQGCLQVPLAHCSVQNFNNEKYEVAQYDKHLASYEKSSLKIATSLAYLNSGQNVIFSSALTLMMFLAAQGVVSGQSSSFRCTNVSDFSSH